MEASISLHYSVIGSGMPMVFLHGFPLDHTIWYSVVDILNSSDLQIILPDLRGHGLSPAPEGVYTMDLMANDILNLLDELGIQKAILVGHSMGGYVSLAFSRRYPDRLAGLALIATQALADSPEKRQSRLDTANAVLERGSKVICETMPSKLTDKEEIMEKIVSTICRTPPEGIVGALKGMAERPDLTTYLPSIDVPAVVVAGVKDTIIHPENAQLMSRRLGNAWLVKIQQAGHMPMLEAPEQVAVSLTQLAQKVSLRM
ncbi:MAG: alpha/beta hydrolase [Anaerolineae bacterium]|nr:alpha/beta hydrolase [Anaerolineae bacterium]